MKKLFSIILWAAILVSPHFLAAQVTVVDPQTFTSDTTISDNDETYGRPGGINKKFTMKYIRKYVRAGFSGVITVNAITGAVNFVDDQVGWTKLTPAVRDSIQNSSGGSSLAGGIEIPIILMFGESNSGGYAVNADLSPTELGIRKEVNIWSNVRNRFEFLDIGTNNLENHSGLATNATHGFENGIANDIRNRYGLSSIYLLKAGQGGSSISQWGSPGAYYDTLAARVTKVNASLSAWGFKPKWYVWISIGINDAIAVTNPATFETAMRALFTRVRTTVGQSRAPIILTRIFRTNASYQAIDDKILEIANEDTEVYAASISGATTRDANHWDSGGMSLISQRMSDIMLDSIGLVGGYRGYTRADIVAPALVSAAIGDGNTSRITLTYNEALDASSVPTTGNYTVSGGKTVTAVSISGSTVRVDVNTPYVNGDVITISYTGTAVRDAALNQAATLTSQAVTNSISGGSLTAVTWGTLDGGSTDSGSGTLTSNGSAAGSAVSVGGTATTTIDNSGAWELRWRLSTTSLGENDGAVIALDDVNSSKFWGQASVTNVCAYYVFSNIQQAHVGSTASGATALTSATLGDYKRFLKSGNDVLLQTSSDESSWTTFHTFTGVLTGLTTLYIKGTYAIGGGVKKIFFVRK